MQSGQRIGEYRLEGEIGTGSFGVVWHAASETNPTRDVALKFVIASADETVSKEIESWKKASGPSFIVDFIDWFPYRDPDDGKDKIVLVSEYVPDGSLSKRLLERGRLKLEVAVRLTCTMLEALDHLHNNRIVHRDLKPANILMNGDQPKIGDFGTARLLDDHTASYLLRGTPSYMAPEVFMGNRLAPVDVWSAGIILYELIAGHVPFRALTDGELRRMINEDPPPPLWSVTPGRLVAIIQWALAKNPSSRPIAAEMSAALKRWLDTDLAAAEHFDAMHDVHGRIGMNEETVSPDAPTVELPSANDETVKK